MFFKHIFYFCYLICLLCFCLAAFLCSFVCAKSFCKKIKKFKTGLITSFVLLLNYHDLFQLLQFISIIKIFSIINYFFIIDTIFMKISQFDHLTYIFYRQNMTNIFCQFHMFQIYAFYFEFFSFCVQYFFH